jgi:hypothetical protein
LQGGKFPRESQRPGEASLGRIDGKHLAAAVEIDFAQHGSPGQQRFERRSHCRARRGREQPVGGDHTRGKHRLLVRGSARRQCLAQPAAGLARGHDDELRGEIERAVATPIAGEKVHRLRQQRLVPRQEMAADVGGRRHDSR